MPFINGRFCMNPAYGQVLEGARAAEPAPDEPDENAHWVTIDGRHVLIRESQAGRAQHPQHPPLTPIERQLAAVAYSEKTDATPEEARAIVSVIQNRVRSNDRQYVEDGQPVNTQNVLRKKDAFQGVDGPLYDQFLANPARDPGARNAAQAVLDVQAHGPSTDATFFLVTPGGREPTDKEKHNLGNVEPANPRRIGDVYLYRPRRNAARH